MPRLQMQQQRRQQQQQQLEGCTTLWLALTPRPWWQQQQR
jgi:hypothetical protein